MTSSTNLLQAHSITKRYGATTALQEAGFDLRAGEVHALLGSNGSGKSTLTKIITGLVAPDSGQIELQSGRYVFRSPREARSYKIAAVYQELSLVPDLSVEDNIWLGHELGGRFSINQKTTRQQTQELLDLFAGATSARFKPETKTGELSANERQLVEILKAISNRPHILILDEATASLDGRQVDRLFELVQQWKNQGLGIVMVTHRLEEIFRIANRATVLRNGRVVGSVQISETTREALVQLISGEASRALHDETKTFNQARGKVALSLRLHDHPGSKLRKLDLELSTGEIVGLGGLQGQGQSELLLSLFGALPMTAEYIVAGQARAFRHPSQAMQAGLAYVPGDRNREGLLGSRSIFENFLLPAWDGFKAGLLLDVEKARKAAIAVGEQLKLKYGGLDFPITSLSGGNAQKVVLGKWLLRSPKVLLLDDPTKGIDVGAKAEFYHLLGELRHSGISVLFYSSDEDELVALCDRVLVMLEGRIVAELSGPNLNRGNLVRSSLGEPSPAQTSKGGFP